MIPTAENEFQRRIRAMRITQSSMARDLSIPFMRAELERAKAIGPSAVRVFTQYLIDHTYYTKDQIDRILGTSSKLDTEIEFVIYTENNGGLLMDDHLGKLRAEAMAHSSMAGGLDGAVVAYISALERAFLEMKCKERQRSLSELAFKIKE